MNLKGGIKTPAELKEAIEIAKAGGETYADAIWAIHKYKWYNWYMGTHIKAGSAEDIENTEIFSKLATEYPQIDADVEFNISHEIDKLNEDD